MDLGRPAKPEERCPRRSGANRRGYGGMIVLLASFLLLPATRASAVEHPGVLHQEDDCLACHADKTRGQSVHSAMATSCTVCHVAQTQGDMTTLNLLMPRDRICSACHEKAAEVRQHSSPTKGLCVDCHDAHASARRMLLRDAEDASPGRPSMLPVRSDSASPKAGDQR